MVEDLQNGTALATADEVNLIRQNGESEYGLVALAALCWGRDALADNWDPLVVSFYRGALGLLFVLVWLALRPRGSGLASRRLWFWSVIAGLGVAGNFAFYFREHRGGQCRGCGDADALRTGVRLSRVLHTQARKTHSA